MFIALVVLSILIMIHELGHFLVAKKSGVWVEEFGFGLPPKIWGKKIGETIYSINLFPFGGFVRLHGEMIDEKNGIRELSFIHKKFSSKVAIVLAGVFMNFLFGILLFSVIYSFTGFPRETGKILITEVVPNSPAEKVGIKANDVITNVNKEYTYNSKTFLDAIEKNKGKKVEVIIKRGEDTISVFVTPRENPPEGEGAMGVGYKASEIYFPPIWQRPLYGAFYGTKEALIWGWQIITTLGVMIVELFKGVVPKDVVGIVITTGAIGEAAKAGWMVLFNFVGIISINLAILNILPLPALDGGRLVFIFLEKIMKKPVPRNIEAMIHTVGMILLLALAALITVSDILKVIKYGSIQNLLQSFMK